jgi:hypothetical protein
VHDFVGQNWPALQNAASLLGGIQTVLLGLEPDLRCRLQQGPLWAVSAEPSRTEITRLLTLPRAYCPECSLLGFAFSIRSFLIILHAIASLTTEAVPLSDQRQINHVMLLPDIDLLVRLCGRSSVGDLLLGPKIEGQDDNQAEHRILRDVLAAKPVSDKRAERLLNGLAKYAKTRPWNSDEVDLFPAQEMPGKWPQDPYLVSLTIWDSICQIWAPNRKWASAVVPAFVKASGNLHGHFIEHDRAGLAYELRRMDGEEWTSWFHSIADQLESSEYSAEGAIAALQIFGLMYLINVYLAEYYEHDLDQLRKVLADLYCVQNGVVQPAMSISGWMV